MDDEVKMFISKDLVDNKPFFKENEINLICSICTGLVVNPVECFKCGKHFCDFCLKESTMKNKQCPNKCALPYIFRPAQILMKNIMEKILLKCSICSNNTTLNKFVTHIKECEEKDSNKMVDCPFCPKSKCKLKKGDFKKCENR